MMARAWCGLARGARAWRGGAAALTLVGCGGAGQPVGAGQRAVAGQITAEAELPWALAGSVAPVATETGDEAASVLAYSFDDEIADPSGFGPRIADMPAGDAKLRQARPRAADPGLSLGLARPEIVRRYLRYQSGEISRCLGDSLKRGQLHAGRIALAMVFDPLGRNVGSAVSESTLRDPLIDACVASAMRESWIPPLGQTLQVQYPLIVTDDQIADAIVDPSETDESSVDQVDAVRRRTARALGRGDAAAAVRGYTALLLQLPDDALGCADYLGLVRAQARAAPWFDERVMWAIEEYGSFARRHPDDLDLAACDAAVGRIAFDAAAILHREGVDLHDPARLRLARARYQRLLSALPAPPRRDDLVYFQAEALYRLAELTATPALLCDAAPLYDEVAARAAGPDRPHGREAGWAAVLSWKECARSGWSPALARQGLAASIDSYLAQAAPDAPDARDAAALRKLRAQLL